MEFISYGALKSSSFFSEATAEMRPSSCPLDGELWYAAAAAAINGGFPAGDDFSVDEYFDLSAGEGFEGEVGGNDDDDEEKRSSSSTTSSSSSLSSSQDQIDEGSSFLAGLSSGDALVSGELAIPVDDMKELEIWSHLMDETVSEEYMAYPSGPSVFTPSPNPWKRAVIEPEPKRVQSKPVDFPANVPAKPRSKLSKKPGPASWLRSPHLRPEISPSSSTYMSSLADGGAEMSNFILIPNPGHVNMGELFVREPAKKKQKRKPATPGLEMGGNNSSAQIRRCTHCQVQKTPQWRTGPLGPKTLCNACGVRYKSGRLFPEYRPACSPTFSSEVHSNSHRKVLEMRKKKDAEDPEIPSCFAQKTATVLSC